MSGPTRGRGRTGTRASGHLRGAATAGMIATRADRLVARPVEWWWRRRLPRGKLVILAGDPGLGKSFLLTDLHARASTGARLA